MTGEECQNLTGLETKKTKQKSGGESKHEKTTSNLRGERLKSLFYADRVSLGNHIPLGNRLDMSIRARTLNARARDTNNQGLSCSKSHF